MSHPVFQSSKFQNWKNNIDSQGIQLKNLNVIGEVSKGDVSLTALIDCLMTTPEGTTMPRCVLLCGEGAVIIPVLTCREDQLIYTLMVKQRRVVDGSWTFEFPAGTFDPQQEEPLSVAVQEIEEELGMAVTKNQLHLLNAVPLNTAPSIMTAKLHYYYFEQEVPKSFLKDIDGKSTGCHDDHEYLSVHVQKIAEVCQINTNVFVLAGIKLLEQKLNQVF